MKRKEKDKEPEVDYYKLNKEAIEDLASANDEGEKPEYSKEELKRYKSSASWHLPTLVKVIFIKFWFAGAVCFFFIWGLGMYLQNLDMLLITAIGMGFVMDFLENSVLRFMSETDSDVQRYIMFPKKRFIDLFFNTFYSVILTVLLYFTYYLINSVFQSIRGNTDKIIAVEPILFGLIFAGWDFVFLGFRRLFKRMFSGALQKDKRQT